MILDMVIKNKHFSCFMVQTWNQSNCLMIASDPASFNLMSIDPEKQNMMEVFIDDMRKNTK